MEDSSKPLIKLAQDSHIHEYLEQCVQSLPLIAKQMFDSGRCWFTIIEEDRLTIGFKKSVHPLNRNMVITNVLEYLNTHNIEVPDKDVMN